MNITKYQNVISNYNKAKKDYENMLTTLQTDIRKKCKLKMLGIANELELTPAMLRYYFRSKKMPQNILKKLLKLIANN